MCRMQLLVQNARKAGVWASPQATAYWTYHMGRTSLLALQGVAGEPVFFLLTFSRYIQTISLSGHRKKVLKQPSIPAHRER